MKVVDKGLQAAVAAAGSEAKLAAAIGISQQAVQQWRKVPAERILDVEQATGVPREKLRPDLSQLFQPSRRPRATRAA